jgi:large subunit ribosomal protein L3
MAGHLGDERITTLNLKIVAVEAEQGLVMVKGSVPGAEGASVQIRDAIKRVLPKDAPLPAGLKTKSDNNAGAAA